MRIPDRPTWPQALGLMLALSGAAGLGGNQLATSSIFQSSPAAQAQASDAAQARADNRRVDNALLIETLTKLQGSVEKLNETVQVLSTKVAVIEDRQRRTR